MSEVVEMVQVCPYDRAPFRDICRAYEAAATTLGWRCHTVFLHSPDSLAPTQLASLDAVGGYSGLAPSDLPSLGSSNYHMQGVDDPVGLRHLRSLRPSTLSVYHRYRSLRVARKAKVQSPREVLVAHEFGLLDSRRRRLYLKYLQRSVRLAGVSPAVAADLGTQWVLPNTLIAEELDQRRVSRAAARAHLRLGGSEIVVGVLGRLHRKKNVELALRGFVAFAQRLAAAGEGKQPASEQSTPRLVLLGDGPLRAPLERLVAQLQAETKAPFNIQFAGFVPDGSRYMAAFDALLFPASGAEAFGMAALEAMLARVPVVCSEAPGPAWVLGDTASYFAGADPQSVGTALARCLDTPKHGRDRVRAEFSPAALAKQLLAIAK